ncbi:hypothetical protein [Aquipuribacter sp. MA13-13]|uniref:hypothetical protein n=1 Tax=Aquipuribacter sp. MA13-13 TaxID=3440840 RepID=UPI003EEECFCE
MLTLAAALVWGAYTTVGWSAIGFGLTLGLAAGSIRSLEAASFPRYFGTLHLGSIRGIVALVSVGSTAFGPLLFALVRDATGSYQPALLGAAAVPMLVAVAAVFVGPPSSPATTPLSETATPAAP